MTSNAIFFIYLDEIKQREKFAFGAPCSSFFVNEDFLWFHQSPGAQATGLVRVMTDKATDGKITLEAPVLIESRYHYGEGN